jgi:hypothetical protein
MAVASLATAVLLAGTSDTSAQTGAAVAPTSKIGCFRGAPPPVCTSFWIVEMQAQKPVAQTRRPVLYHDEAPVRMHSFESEIEWNVGHMVNLTPTFALGGVVTLGTGAEDRLAGVKVRARRWLDPSLSLEVQAGLLRTDNRQPTPVGLTGDVRLNIRDQGSVFVRWDGLSLSSAGSPAGPYFDPGGFQQALSFGIGAGSMPAVIGTGALGLGFAIVLGLVLSDSN